MRNIQRGRVAGRKGAAHLRSNGRAFALQVESLLFATLGRFFSVLVDVFDHALEDEQIGAALAGELDAIAVVPFDGAAKYFTILKNDSHRRMQLHLLNPVEILRVGRFRWRGLLVRDRTVVLRA